MGYFEPNHSMGPYVLGLRETSRKITSPIILFPVRCILFPSVYCFISFQFSESLQFWQNAMADFCSDDFAVWQAHAFLKRSIKVFLRIELKQRYCEILESVSAVLAKISWNFHPSPCGCSETDNISPVCQYIIEICPVFMACTWKNRVLLAACWDKIPIFHLGQTEHFTAHGDGPLCAPHRALISFIWRRATYRIAREIEIMIFSIFAWLVYTSVPTQNSRLRVFCRTICWLWCSINIYETFGAKKIAVSWCNLVAAPGSETGPNLRTSLFVDRFL